MSEYTMEMRLCDDAGMVSHEPLSGDDKSACVSYLHRLNHLRSLSGHAPYDGEPFPCTGSAHLAGEHIKCTSPAHSPVKYVNVNEFESRPIITVPESTSVSIPTWKELVDMTARPVLL